MRRACVLLASLALLAAGCGGDDPTAAEEAVRQVRAGDAILLDVRTDREFAASHAAETRHFPHEDMVDGARPRLAKDATIYVYCSSGRRAAEAVAILRREGYRDVTSIGGLKDWQAAGGAVVS
ncbi:MAG TPA: rhodanese-like domain-containing protein [Solirubrobacteraceae bacterium]|nr:rhodanese-like domain-containing protein [Solirubrobacteraceae bacterium]